MRIRTLEDIKKMQEQGMSKYTALFHKLNLCVRKALADEDRLGCHLISIYRHLGRCIESNFSYYDTLIDTWAEYFLEKK